MCRVTSSQFVSGLAGLVFESCYLASMSLFRALRVVSELMNL